MNVVVFCSSRFWLLGLLIALLASSGGSPLAAASCIWSPEFIRPGVDGTVYASANLETENGHLLWVGGDFTRAGRVAANGLAIWDGITWSVAPGGLSGVVTALGWLDLGSGGFLYAGGDFSIPGTTGRVHLARWTGSAWSPLGQGPDGPVLSLAVFDDGTGKALFAGGTFANAGGQPVGNIAKWNGSRWFALHEGVSWYLEPRVTALTVFDDGSGAALYVGGSFWTAGSISARSLAKWDGASWSNVGGELQGEVTALAAYDDGTGPALYASGSLIVDQPVIQSGGIAKWDGLHWSMDPELLNGITHVTAMSVLERAGGPQLLVAEQQDSRSWIARWTGSLWEYLGEPVLGEIATIGLYDAPSEGKTLYIGGEFAAAGTRSAGGIAQLENFSWRPMNTGLENAPLGPVMSMAIFDAGDGPSLYVGGWYPAPGTFGYVARRQGSGWKTIGQGNGYGFHLRTLDDGHGLALFSGTVPAKWDGVAWTRLADPPEPAWPLAYFDSGAGPQLYYTGGGSIATYHSTFWTQAGSTWLNFAPVFSWIETAVAFDDGSGPALYVAGDLTQSPLRTGLAKWNGSSWSAVGDWDYRLDFSYVWDLRVLDDGSGPALYKSGYRNYIGGSLSTPVARWDGHAWQNLGPLDPSLPEAAHAVEIFDDGDGPAFYANLRDYFQIGFTGGERPEGSVSLETIYRLDDDTWTPLTSASLQGIWAMTTFDDPQDPGLFVGGEFTRVDDTESSYLAKYTCSPKTDLSLALADGTETAYLGTLLYYTLLVRNLGIVAEPAAHLENQLPSGLGCTFTSRAAGGASGNTPAGSGHLDETLSLPIGSAVTYTFRCPVTAAAVHPLVHTATISGPEADKNLANNSVNDSNALSGPRLYLPPVTSTAQGFTVEVPVSFGNVGPSIAATTFSLDYDSACLDPDADDDGALDQVTITAPGSFTPIVRFDPLDTDGEIDVTLGDWNPPIAALGDGQLLKIRFRATCPAATVAVDSPIDFSTHPAPTFGGLGGQDVPGSSSGGVVRILPGPRGDCNGDHALGAGDLVSIGLEIFDGDGEFWLDAPNPPFPGTPVGCDANATTAIRAADVICANLLIFGESCGSTEALPGSVPRIEVSTRFDGSFNWIGVRLVPNGGPVGALALSLDLDPERFAFNRLDSDRDGEPDHWRLPAGNPGFASVSFDPSDGDGELDLLIADLSGHPLTAGQLIEIGVPATAAARRGARISASPPPSFGSIDGSDLAGVAFDGVLVFADGFESGTTSAWSGATP